MPRIVYGRKELYFTLKRKKVKNINIRIKSGKDIIVSAHPSIPLAYIKVLLYTKIPWIEKHVDLNKKEDRNKIFSEATKEKKDTFVYLGKKYCIQSIVSLKEYVEIQEDKICVYMKEEKDTIKKEKLLERWYKKQCKKIFRDSLNRMYEKVKEYTIEYPSLHIRKMKRRWGTCYYTENKIILNSILGKAPQGCIDQVVLHELIHFKHKNHSKDFYAMLSALMPDWEEKKDLLEASTAREL